MKKKIRFIHCADIHLGANPFEIEERFEDMGKAFKQVCDFAIDEKVDFVLIAGDFFHNKQLNPKTLEQAINSLEKLKEKNIPVFLTEGNHDRETYSNTYSWLQFLSAKKYIILLRPSRERGENLLKFWDGENGCIYENNSCYIMGLGYPGSTSSKYINKISDELSNMIDNNKLENKPIICMLHTGIDRFVTESMGGIKEKEIDIFLEKLDYLALGHIHTRYENEEKRYFNPGSLECVRITDNPFNKGFYYVSLDTNSRKIETEFKLVQTRPAISLNINIDVLDKEIDLEQYIIEEIQNEYIKKQMKAKIMLQIKITGTAVINTMKINIAKLKDRIAESVPILHQEIINLIRYVNEEEEIIINDVSREDIDKFVIKKYIKQSGFEEEKIEKVYEIIEKLKEYGRESVIDLESTYGKEIENLLMEL